MAANSSMSRDTTGASSPETIIRLPPSRNESKAGDFQWKYLRDTTVAILPKDAGIPNFPYESVASNAQLLLVRAVIEAHEHVRAGNADIAFTHIDPLDRNELRDFTVIRLSHLAEFGKTRLCLLRRAMSHPSDKENAVNTLSTIATNYLKGIEARHQESARLTEAFNKYRYAYHTSCVRDGSKGLVKRKWLRGMFRFEVFVSHVTSDEQPVWFIKAIHEVHAVTRNSECLCSGPFVRHRPAPVACLGSQPTLEASKDQCESLFRTII